jgi:predicted GNAT family acetyltransferase
VPDAQVPDEQVPDARLEVRDRPERSRYELLRDGVVIGVADYHLRDGVVVFPHTLVEPAWRGKGMAALLVARALDDVRAAGRRIEPQCWYVADFVDAHPEYHDLLPR